MRMEKPRVAPLALEDLDSETRARFGGGSVLRIFTTLARHPDLLKRWLVFGNHVLFKSTLAARERELVILRVGWLCQAGYEWGQHVLIGRDSGLSDEEIERIPDGAEAKGWSAGDQWLLRATDELHGDAFISDASWQGLAETLSIEQLLDLIFTVGQYNLVSMALNSLGVQPEDGLPRLPVR
ncbi:MAG TPA: carboxymuconolactone decarboxylase family protein [Myxococcales bacterium]|nr:carboxymuconolactone decarboxylase family protein [Myxococcales bacterium]HIL01895.1 carboxymuconolactone decarboxylase family protein [Myxococcales bacterium]